MTESGEETTESASERVRRPVRRMSRGQRLRRQRKIYLRHIPPLEGEARAYLGSAQELLHQVAGNTVRGFGSPPKPWMRWLEALWLAPTLWVGMSTVVLFTVCFGGVALNAAFGSPSESDAAFGVAFAGVMGLMGGALGLWRLAQIRRAGRPLHTAGRRAREEHVMAELLFQILVRHDVTSGALDSEQVGLYTSDRGWDVALPTREGAAHDQRHWLSLRCDEAGQWAFYAFVVGDRETNPWLGVDWGGVEVPEATFDPHHELWRLNLCMEDRDGLLTEFTDHKPALKDDANALLAAWADRVSRALQPVLKQPGERVSGTLPSRWGSADGASQVVDEPEGPRSVALALPASHASYDPEPGSQVWKRARLARMGSWFGRLVTVLPVLWIAGSAAFEGELWGAMGASVVTVCMGAFYAQLSRMLDRATLPPSKVRTPKVAEDAGLAWDGETLALGEAQVGLERAFACTLSRRLGGSEGQTPMLVVDLVPQRKPGEAEEARGRVRFQVEVERSEAWERLDRLEVHAPTLPGDAFDGWVWPLIQARLLAHGADLPGFGAGRAVEAVVGVSGARRGAQGEGA